MTCFESGTADRLCTVALLSPPFASLTYSVPEWLADFAWPTGLRVGVPLGKGKLRAGVILATEGSPLPSGVTPRPMLWPLEREPLLPPEYLEMVHQLSLRQAVMQGKIFAAVFPSGLRLTRMYIRCFDTSEVNIYQLPSLTKLSLDKLHSLGLAWLKGKAELLSPHEDAASTEFCELHCDQPWPVRPTATRQIRLLDLLLQEGTISRRAVLQRLGSETAGALNTLIRHGLISLRPNAEINLQEEASLLPPPKTPQTLSPAQNKALCSLLSELDEKRPISHLLFGITGSGKTAVYLELARACLKRGMSILLLAPEVALAIKLHRDVQLTLPDAPLFFYHGYQLPSTREKTFRTLAARHTPCIVVGTRSALFLPLPQLGAIILDEEHDTSFKQNQGLPYQGKELAWFRTVQNNGLLLLGSATPDLKTFYAARQGTISLSTLPNRVGGGTLPAIKLIDIRANRATGGKCTSTTATSILAPESLAALHETIARGEQAVVLLNRRGYAPFMYCLHCCKVLRCPSCDISLTYHKGSERLMCHYCGYSLPFPAPCPACGGLHFYPLGQGTERIEEDIATQLPPNGRVLRLDRDSTYRTGRMEEILNTFARGEAQVLVGTQMLSKGHHFPNVTLAIIADADIGLNLPDYRAAERTFQLLIQSAGRAGRGEKPGQVLIQTHDINHYCWKFIQKGDYEGFYAHEIELRRHRRYPPFINLALLRASWPVTWADGPGKLATISAMLRSEGARHGITVLGPAPAPLSVLRGRKRFHCLLKAPNWKDIRALYTKVLPLAAPPYLRISLDIDPVNML